MGRAQAKTITQVEREQDFIFGTTDANAPEKQDKRSAPKEFEIERDETGLYTIKYSAGGETPAVLKGRWTSIWRANEAIDNYKVTKAQQQGGAAGSSTAS